MKKVKDIELRYCPIVFLQGGEADEPLKILNELGYNQAFNYLLQWDYGDRYQENKEPCHGSSDYTWHGIEGYILSYNLGLGYIGLEAIIEKEVEVDQD